MASRPVADDAQHATVVLFLETRERNGTNLEPSPPTPDDAALQRKRPIARSVLGGTDAQELLELLLDRPQELQVVLMLERRSSQDIAAFYRDRHDGCDREPTLKTAPPAASSANVDQVPRGQLSMLSQREREVLDLLVQGHPNKIVAHRLSISPRTVETHRAQIMRKMKARNFAQLVRIALSDDGNTSAS
jgi:DNA-binding NarL/FixJ family response regulator